MAFGKLFTFPGNPRTTGILAVAKANGIELDVVEAEVGNPTAEHKNANKLGKVPAFVGEDGYALSEAIAVAIYITSQNEKTTLLGKTKQDYATILKWLSFFNSEALTTLSAWYRPLLGKDPYNKKAVEEASKKALSTVAVIEEHLLHNTYLVGERITLADFFGAGIISRGFEFFFDKQWREQNPATTRWFQTISAQPVFSAVAPKLTLLDTPALTNVAPKAAPKAAPNPAKETPKPAAPAAEEPQEAPKPKHPCEALGKASVPLDEWKRQYSNSETPDALKWFWENISFEEYSIWKFTYKYNEELTLTFMSSNLIGGFNARLEASRKYLFGCGSVYGENNDSVIQGAFVIRGQDYLPVFDVAPDYESYEFTKLDPTNEEDRKYLEDEWTWERPLTINGKQYPHAAGKVIK
jgi:elongation factor 1-gamma